METGESLLSWSLKAYGKEPNSKIAAIVNYESGDLSRDFIRIEDYPDCPELYERQAKISMGDVIAMCRLLCAKQGWDFSTIDKEGCQRAIERCKEKLQGKNGF